MALLFEPTRSPYILQIKFRFTEYTIGASCMIVYIATFLIYPETIFKDMIYMILIFEVQMIYMYHMDDLISENSVLK